MNMRDAWELTSFIVTTLALPFAIVFFAWEQRKERFDMLVSLFERAYLVAYKPAMGETERRRWNSWDDYMREWCHRDDFFNALPLLLRGEDPEFQEYIRALASEERGTLFVATT